MHSITPKSTQSHSPAWHVLEESSPPGVMQSRTGPGEEVESGQGLHVLSSPLLVHNPVKRHLKGLADLRVGI